MIIRYDFLWREEARAGQSHGRKDRPCAIVLVAKTDEKGQQMVLVCPITHTPPASEAEAVKVPLNVALALGLDSEQSWIKVDQLNRFRWPFGLSPAKRTEWTFGFLPPRLFDQVLQKLFSNRRRRTVVVDRWDE